MANTSALRISPMLAVADIRQTIEFYAEVLGFRVSMQSQEYAILERERATIHLTLAADESVMAAVRGHASIYLEVDDIGPLWGHVEDFRDRYRIRDLFDRDYGMREFHIEDPNECLVFVGQQITGPVVA